MGAAHRTVRRGRTALATATVSAALTAGLLVAATPAVAHPFGPPLRGSVATEDDLVLVGWGAAEDDWVALGRALGVLDGPRDRLDPDATVPRTGFELLAEDERVAHYLLDHIQAHQDGRSCAGEVSFPDDLSTLLATGVIVQLTCPDHVSEVDLTITALTDLHPAYRTVVDVVGSDVRRVHTLDDPTHPVDPDAAPFRFGRQHLAGATGTAALVAALIAWVGGRRPDGAGAAPDDTSAPSAPEEVGSWS